MSAVKNIQEKKAGFGTAPVFFTSISSILGAILFLRLGFATGMLGFWGVFAIIILGHMITVPTALAISELATNTRVEGGGEYFIISRSFGLKIGSTIGVTLFLSQTISIAFYIIAFAESFHSLYEWWSGYFGFELPRQAISVPTLLLMSYLILKKGAGSGVKLLYIVNLLLAVALVMFFMGKPVADPEAGVTVIDNFRFSNPEQFFILFAICFPAFTGMTVGVGLSGDLKNPGRSIPFGTMAGTLTGLLVYLFVIWKLSVSASQADLLEDQLIMSRIALYGSIVIPIGLAACTSSSALGAMMVAPRTLQAIASDKTFPFRKLNLFFARGRGATKEPRNASLISFAIAMIFVLLGDVNSVAEIISMFFLITYGTLCLSSFLNHFGSPPSYRPRFKSKWFLSLAGFVLSVWVMFMINPLYTILSYIIIIVIYLFIEQSNKEKKGLVNIFKGALFQLNRQLQVYMQKHQATMEHEEWRPAAVCVSPNSFDREKPLELMKWISHQHGFGTYFHYIEGYYGRQTYEISQEILKQIVDKQKEKGSTLYIDTMISPSYTSAIAQVIQTPSISGMENNLVVFEYEQDKPHEIATVTENINLVKAGNYDVCIFSCTDRLVKPVNGIHVWIRSSEDVNANFMILLGYIIMSHPEWRKSHIKIFLITMRGESSEIKSDLENKIAAGRLPITLANIEIVYIPEGRTVSEVVRRWSGQAALTLIGFTEQQIAEDPVGYFADFHGAGDILFVNNNSPKEIT